MRNWFVIRLYSTIYGKFFTTIPANDTKYILDKIKAAFFYPMSATLQFQGRYCPVKHFNLILPSPLSLNSHWRSYQRLLKMEYKNTIPSHCWLYTRSEQYYWHFPLRLWWWMQVFLRWLVLNLGLNFLSEVFAPGQWSATFVLQFWYDFPSKAIQHYSKTLEYCYEWA